MIIYNSKLVPKGFNGITIWPFILLKKKKTDYQVDRLAKLINHERIHLRQQLELLVIPFFILYGLNYLINVLKKREKPYRDIIFELEAYQNEDNLDYLKWFTIYNWLFARYRK